MDANKLDETTPPQAPVPGEPETDEMEPGGDPELEGAETEVARAAREERARLLPEYMEHYFLEDLPMIDPEDPFNQGIYMRFRLNQMRSATGKEPVE